LLAHPSQYVISNYTFSTELTAMSETTPATAKLSPPPFIIVKSIAGHALALKALAPTSTDSLDPAMIHTSYINAIHPSCTLYSSENLTDWFTALVTVSQDLMLKRDTTIAKCNTLIVQVT
jgi:hypothetical protein